MSRGSERWIPPLRGSPVSPCTGNRHGTLGALVPDVSDEDAAQEPEEKHAVPLLYVCP